MSAAKLFNGAVGRTGLVAAVGLVLAARVPATYGEKWAALLGVGLAVVTGVVGLLLKRRVASQGLGQAFKVVGVVFGMRAVAMAVGLVWVVRQELGAVAFVAGFFGTYFVLQWIELSYVMAASKGAAGGDA